MLVGRLKRVFEGFEEIRLWVFGKKSDPMKGKERERGVCWRFGDGCV